MFSSAAWQAELDALRCEAHAVKHGHAAGSAPSAFSGEPAGGPARRRVRAVIALGSALRAMQSPGHCVGRESRDSRGLGKIRLCLGSKCLGWFWKRLVVGDLCIKYVLGKDLFELCFVCLRVSSFM